jgi:integrase
MPPLRGAIARDIDARSLAAVRARMISGSWLSDEERGQGRRAQRTARLEPEQHQQERRPDPQLLSLGVLEKLVHANVVTDLDCLPPLRFGRRGARESPTVTPVAIADDEATIPHMPPVVADMVRVQLLTGCRPGELCDMRMAELDRSQPSGKSGSATTRRGIAASSGSSPSARKRSSCSART